MRVQTRHYRKCAAALIVVALVLASAQRARADQIKCPDSGESAYYSPPAQVDLALVLAPPPGPDSPAQHADVQGVIDVQSGLTQPQIDAARADVDASIFRFNDVMGPGFSADKLPFASAFFARMFCDEGRDVWLAKAHFNRLRPFAADPRVKRLVEQQPNYSYPSGHATFAYSAAIVLANMVPEKAAAIFDRAASYARNRIVVGVHYPADIEAGRIAAAVIENAFFHDERFKADYARARAEVRHALGLN